MKAKSEDQFTEEKKMTRSEFLSLTGKAAAGIGLGILFLKISGLLPGDKRRGFTVCNTNGICSKCTLVPTCELPQALSFRTIKGGKI